MKRFLLLLSVTTLLISFTIKPINASSKEFNGAVKQITKSTYYASEKSGRIIKGELEYVAEYFYNSDEKLVRQSFYIAGAAWADIITYEYNNDGQLVVEKFHMHREEQINFNHKYNSDGKLMKYENENGDVIDYKYNNAGQLVSEKRSGGTESRVVEGTYWEYNSTGELMEKKHYDQWGSNIYKYDSSGENVIRNVSIREGGDMDVYEYEYNIDGQRVKMIHHSEDECGMPSGRKTVSEYKYTKLDDEKNWIERIEFIDGEVSEITIRKITYHK